VVLAREKGSMRRRLLTTWAAVAGAAATYHFLIRPRILRRGATDEEVVRVLPGDEMVRPGTSRSTMATTISATPEQIWPWLVQVGWSRGAFYSYNRIEGLLGMDLHNADRVHPEWQNLTVGDTMWMSHPRLSYLFPETRAVRIDPNQALVFAIYGRPDGNDPSGAWSFVLEPIDDKSTRLIARLQIDPPPLFGKLVIYGFMEPAHFVMQDGMFRGLKERIQRERRSPHYRREEVTHAETGAGAGGDVPLDVGGPAVEAVASGE
jgi:hypothetical protein